jgi:hypothetical protein
MNCAELDPAGMLMELDLGAGAESDFAAGAGGDGEVVLVPSARAEPIMRPPMAVVIMSFLNIPRSSLRETESPRTGQRVCTGDVPAEL